MTDNPCLHEASLSERVWRLNDGLAGKWIPHAQFKVMLLNQLDHVKALEELYDAEWAKRGFKRAP